MRITMTRISKSVFLLMMCLTTAKALEVCPGETRDDRKCNQDPTHRVCAKIGVDGTSFWKNTEQDSWCGTKGDYGGEFGNLVRCPKDKPTWCICKWATARWIKGQGCDSSINFNCGATDVCNLKRSYKDFDVELKPAHDCMKIKCKKEWNACPDPPPKSAKSIKGEDDDEDEESDE